jgi:hypothetical protein
MKLGLGLYRHQFNAEHYRFARPYGCIHLVIHTDAPNWPMFLKFADRYIKVVSAPNESK